MNEDEDYRKRHVTNAELADRLRDIPTRFEVRFLIVLAIVANQLIPTVDVARAAIQVIS